MASPHKSEKSNSEPIKGSRSLLHNLPSEILQAIVDAVLQFPGRIGNTVFPTRTALEYFDHPIMSTSKQLRQHGLDILANRCFWIRLNSTDVETWARRFPTFLYIFALSTRKKIMLRNMKLRHTLDILVETSGHSKAWISCLGNFLLFPYSSQTWTSFVRDLGEHIYNRPREVSRVVRLRCESTAPTLRLVLDTLVLPSLLRYQLSGLTLLSLEGSGLRHVTSHDKQQPLHGPDYDSHVDRARDLLQHVQTLKDHNLDIDAAITLVEAGICHQIARFIDSFRTSPMGSKQLELRQILLTIEFRGACSLYDLFMSKRLNIHDLEKQTSRSSIKRWPHLWENLPLSELAKVRFITAMVQAIDAKIRHRFDSSVVVEVLHKRAWLAEQNVRRLSPDLPELALLENLRRQRHQI